MDRTEWPTPHYLNSLREEGIFYYNPVVTRCLLLMTLLVAVLVAGERWNEILTTHRSLVVTGIKLGEGELPVWQHLLFQIGNFMAAIGVTFGAIAFLSIVVHSKFLVRLSFLKFDVGRTNPFARGGGGEGFIIRTMRLGGIFVISILGAAVVTFLGSQAILSLLNKTVTYFIRWPRTIIEGHLAIWLILLLVITVGSWLFGWYRFMLKHRMTRTELQAELQE